MPTIDVDLGEFEKLLGVAYDGDVEKLDADLAFVKSEVKLYNREDGTASVEIKDTNRPDLWSVEGLARALSGYLGIEKGLKEYVVGDSVVDISVDSRLSTIRPFMGCAIVKDVELTDTVIRGLMHLQDKLDQTYGRNRQKTSIGLYDFNLIVPPLRYTAVKPEAVSFVPLGFTEEMSLTEILERHPKGIEYGSIVKRHEVYPIIVDAQGKVLSFPPIINSNDLGRVTAETHNVLVEVTGTMHETVLNTLKLVALAMADRSGKVSAATVRYAADGLQVVTPDFRSRLMILEVDYTNKILGLRLTGKRIAELLLTAGFGIENVSVESVGVLVPCYRVDVMHPVDLVEDVAVAYGYNNIAPVWRELPTTGCVKPEQRLLDVARELLVGLGFQEVLTYNLTNSEALFDRMNREKNRVVEVTNPKVVTMTCLRNWLLPSLVEFLSSNQSVEFPQRIFELGKVTLLDDARETKTRDEDWLAAVTSHAAASFTEIKSCLDAFFRNFGVDWQIRETVHSSFIEGRVGAVMVNGEDVGVVGEVYPGVLEAWKLENPAAAFEINLEKIIQVKQGK
jgi:phenylalanyl-tRNA synthetase beta chain